MLNKGYIYTDRVQAVDDGATVLDYYVRHYHRFSRAEWRRRLGSGQARSEGRVLSATDTVHGGMLLQYHRPPWEEEDVPTKVAVLYDDSSCMVFAKPSGLQVLPGGGFLENTMLRLVRSRYDDRLAPMHRLGRGTSGAILFSRTREASVRLSEAMRERRIEKTYLALVAGCGMPGRFTVTQPIGPVHHPLLGSVHAANDRGKPSISHCRVLERREEENTSLLEVVIPTGRPHQIRIHLATAGWPLRGDPLYGPGGGFLSDDGATAAVPGDCGYLLHSWKLEFPHPLTDTSLTIVAPPPPELLPR